ncbi:MAG TPA: DUF742 domain-containing protein [Pseudonocardia sp.]
MNEPPRMPERRPAVRLPSPPRRPGRPPHEYPPLAPEVSDTEAARVRPFVVTGGRTRPLHDGLRIESLVLATAKASTVPLRFEQRQLVELAHHAVSLAEVAARLAVPIGVARVLVSDLQQEELIKIVEPHELPRAVIERIRELVKAL